jgi:predicted nucleic acid-binding protein
MAVDAKTCAVRRCGRRADGLYVRTERIALMLRPNRVLAVARNVREPATARAGDHVAARRPSIQELYCGLREARHVRLLYRSVMKFVVACDVVLQLAADDSVVPARHKLLAPTLLRSGALSALHEAVARGELTAQAAREQLARINKMPIRLLGDAVLRRRAWEIADELGWAETYDAEYLALTQLQADAFVTLDAKLAREAAKVVPTATIDALQK